MQNQKELNLENLYVPNWSVLFLICYLNQVYVLPQ